MSRSTEHEGGSPERFTPETLRGRVNGFLTVADSMTQRRTKIPLYDDEGVFVPTPKAEVLPLFGLLASHPGRTYVDIGSGSGQLAITAGMLGLVAHGYETNEVRHTLATDVLIVAQECGLVLPEESNRIHLHHEDFFTAPIAHMDYLTYWYGSGQNVEGDDENLPMIEAKLLQQGKHGALLAVYDYHEGFSYLEIVSDSLAGPQSGLSKNVRLFRVP